MGIIYQIIKNPVDIFLLFVVVVMFEIAATSLIKECIYLIKHKKVRRDPFLFIVYSVILFLALAGFHSRFQFYSALQALSRQPEQQTTLKIYPKRYGPDAQMSPFTISSPDPMVEEFLLITPHLRAEWFRHGTFTSWNLIWYMEVISGQSTISLTCSLQPGMDNLVLGQIGRVDASGKNRNYGSFQSQHLFQWYQKYSHRWLEPDSSTQQQPSSQ